VSLRERKKKLTLCSQCNTKAREWRSRKSLCGQSFAVIPQPGQSYTGGIAMWKHNLTCPLDWHSWSLVGEVWSLCPSMVCLRSDETLLQCFRIGGVTNLKSMVETVLLIKDFIFYFIIFLVGRGRGRRRERILSRLHVQHRAWRGARSHDPEIMTWAKIKSQMLNRLSHPGTPLKDFFWFSLRKSVLSWTKPC